jgi:predicted nucleic acid-binding protein
MYLVDTNVWLEVLLAQQQAPEAKAFFERIDAGQLAITEFSLYSLGIILTRLNKDEAFTDQYTAAEKHDLVIVSFDKGFDRTKRGRKTPAEIIGASA